MNWVRARRAAHIAFAVFLALTSGAATPTEAGDRALYSKQELDAIYQQSPLGPLPRSATNRVADDGAVAALGQRLFFDSRLSGNGQVSCATCHRADLALTDGRAVAKTLATGTRNTPTLLNAAYQHWFFWDGRADSMWSQALQVMENPKEFGGDRLHIARTIYGDPVLRRGYESAFGPMPPLGDLPRFPPHGRPDDRTQGPYQKAWEAMTPADRDSVNRVFSNAGKAIEAYERKLVSQGSPFDRYVEGLKSGDPAKFGALSLGAKRGLKLFVGEARCVLCHFGPAFSDGEFHNIGLPILAKRVADKGRADAIRALKTNIFNGTGPYSDARKGTAKDKLAYLPPSESELGKFKTPTLRNVAKTAPYMHDGRFTTLEQVVQFYADGRKASRGKHVGVREATLELIPSLTPGQVADLVAFLNTLNGAELPQALVEKPLSD